MKALSSVKERRKAVNPYVGPRAFDRGETMYGRDHEAAELCDLLISERIVLLHAPSGAGKTSLVEAAAVPLLKAENFSITAPLRVNTPAPAGVHNGYVHSVNLALLGKQAQSWGPGLETARLGQVLDRLDEQEAGTVPRDRVLFFDQFEEIVVLNTADYDGRAEFFAQLGEALSNPHRWALFAIREDFLGRFDAFRARMPTHLRATMRLDFMERGAARRAMIEPARILGTEFTEEAADRIFDHLAVIQADVNGRTEQVPSHNVEPVQLQVICNRLWRSKRGADKRAPARITVSDIDRLDFNTYLAGFYDDVLDDVAKETGAEPLVLRTWFDNELITPDGWRRQTRLTPQTVDVDSDTVLAALERHYLINSDLRGGVIWYELAHDRMLRPVIDSNITWFDKHLPPLRRAADAWVVSGRREELLVSTWLELATARAWAESHADSVTDEVREFLDASSSNLKAKSRLKRAVALSVILWFLVVAQFAVIVWLLATRT